VLLCTNSASWAGQKRKVWVLRPSPHQVVTLIFCTPSGGKPRGCSYVGAPRAANIVACAATRTHFSGLLSLCAHDGYRQVAGTVTRSLRTVPDVDPSPRPLKGPSALSHIPVGSSSALSSCSLRSKKSFVKSRDDEHAPWPGSAGESHGRCAKVACLCGKGRDPAARTRP